jgi:hypothetical protein
MAAKQNTQAFEILMSQDRTVPRNTNSASQTRNRSIGTPVVDDIISSRSQQKIHGSL